MVETAFMRVLQGLGQLAHQVEPDVGGQIVAEPVEKTIQSFRRGIMFEDDRRPLLRVSKELRA